MQADACPIRLCPIRLSSFTPSCCFRTISPFDVTNFTGEVNKMSITFIFHQRRRQRNKSKVDLGSSEGPKLVWFGVFRLLRFDCFDFGGFESSRIGLVWCFSTIKVWLFQFLVVLKTKNWFGLVSFDYWCLVVSILGALKAQELVWFGVFRLLRFDCFNFWWFWRLKIGLVWCLSTIDVWLFRFWRLWKLKNWFGLVFFEY